MHIILKKKVVVFIVYHQKVIAHLLKHKVLCLPMAKKSSPAPSSHHWIRPVVPQTGVLEVCKQNAMFYQSLIYTPS